jgi:SAM-dependent methyltransferase
MYRRPMTDLLSVLERGKRHTAFRPCGDEGIAKGRAPLQMGWYRLAAAQIVGNSVLDVGAGMGEGLRVLAAHAPQALGIEVDERLRRSDDIEIEIRDLASMPDDSFDTVVCIDVIEHVESDAAFVEQLMRVARRRVFVSTPNYALGLNEWPFHVREYTPRQLHRMLAPFGRTTEFGGSSSGDENTEIRRRALYHLISDLYGYRGAHILGKILRRPLGVRVWGHQAIVVDLP